MESAAIIDNPAPDNDASVKSLGIFLQRKENKKTRNFKTNKMLEQLVSTYLYLYSIFKPSYLQLEQKFTNRYIRI